MMTLASGAATRLHRLFLLTLIRSLVIAVTLIGISAPTIQANLLVDFEESQLPLEDEEEVEQEEYISHSAQREGSRLRRRRVPVHLRTWPCTAHQRSPKHAWISPAVGHRWSNGMLAPLTC